MRSVLIGSEYPVTGTPRFLSPIHRREEMRLLYVGFFVVRQIFINYRVILRSCAWLIARQTEHGISFCCDFLAANVRIPAHPIHQWKSVYDELIACVMLRSRPMRSIANVDFLHQHGADDLPEAILQKLLFGEGKLFFDELSLALRQRQQGGHARIQDIHGHPRDNIPPYRALRLPLFQKRCKQPVDLRSQYQNALHRVRQLRLLKRPRPGPVHMLHRLWAIPMVAAHGIADGAVLRQKISVARERSRYIFFQNEQTLFDDMVEDQVSDKKNRTRAPRRLRSFCRL